MLLQVHHSVLRTPLSWSGLRPFQRIIAENALSPVDLSLTDVLLVRLGEIHLVVGQLLQVKVAFAFAISHVLVRMQFLAAGLNGHAPGRLVRVIVTQHHQFTLHRYLAITCLV
jgi:hypothetical protein